MWLADSSEFMFNRLKDKLILCLILLCYKLFLPRKNIFCKSCSLEFNYY